MSRTMSLAVLMLAAFVVLAGCGSGPGIDETSSGGFAAAIDPLGFGLLSVDGYAGGDEAVDEADNVLSADVAAASPLRLWLSGGRGLQTDPASGKKYYPMRVGETRPIVATWTGGPVGDPPVWKREGGGYSPLIFNAMTSAPTTLSGNFLVATYEVSQRPLWVKVTYGGYTTRIWVWPRGTWSPIGQTAELNAAGARLKIRGSSSQWGTTTLDGCRAFWTKQSGEVTLKGIIVPGGSYPGAPKPTWTAHQNQLQFVGPATGWNIKFRIKGINNNWLTAKIGNFAVTVIVRIDR